MANVYLPPVLTTPGFLLITNMTNALQMVVTITNSDLNTYQIGQLVHLTVPSSYGMWQADQKTGKILGIIGDAFTLNIDSTAFDAFVTPVTYEAQPASLSPAGSNNLEYGNNSATLPFKSLNNIGN